MIRNYLRPLRKALAIGLILKTIGSLAELLLPYILAYIIDEVVPSGEIEPIYFWSFMMALAALVALLGNIWANRRSARVASDASRRIRKDLFAKTLSLSATQIHHFTEASLEARLTSDTYHVHNMISRLQRIGIRAPMLLSGGLVMTFLLDWQLALVLTGLLPFIAGITLWIAKRGRPKYMRQQEATDNMVRKVRETVSGIKVIKSLVTGEREKEKFGSINADVVEHETDAAYNMALTNPIMTLLMNSGLTLVLIVGAILINRGRSEYGSIVAFLTYFTIITNSMVAITRIFTIYNRGMASADRIEEILTQPDSMSWKPLATTGLEATTDAAEHSTAIETLPAGQGSLETSTSESRQAQLQQPSPAAKIEFRNVSYRYRNAKEDAVKNLNFRLGAGEMLGILGETGSGKSTLIYLLLRLYDAQHGEILIDGVNVKDIPREKLYSLFGVSLQNDFLYGDSIRANIDFGRQLSDEQIIKAAKQAQAWDFISEKEAGLDMQLSSRAGNLSGGQKQRLLLARALADPSDILIFDDSSSALDYQTDAKIRAALQDSFPHTSRVIVAQRISSVRSADQIILLKKGEIIAQGQHEELMEMSAEYRDIAAVQMGLLSKNDEALRDELAALNRAPRKHSIRDDEDGDTYG